MALEPQFLAFYNNDWQDMLERVIVPGVDPDNLSWDRRAAWLLWCRAHQIKPTFTITNHYRGVAYRFDSKGKGLMV